MKTTKRWRVRVRKTIEDWLDITADTKELAEQEASTKPGVISVFVGSTISGERPVIGNTQMGVMDDSEED